MDTSAVHAADTLALLGQSVMTVREVDEGFSPIWNNWTFSSLFLAVFVVLLGALLLRYNIKKWVIGHLKMLALVIWIAGVALYRIGFDDGGCTDNMLALYLRASLSAMEMFVSHSDLIEVKAHCHHSGVYMTVFSVIHFCAVLVSAIFILRLFGLNLLSWIKLTGWRLKCSLGCRSDLAVFWGVNRNAVNMAKSLCRDGKKKVKILFVNLPDNSHQHETSRFSFSHFFHTASADIERYVEEIEESGAVLVNAGKPFRTEGMEGKEASQLFRAVGLYRLCDRLVCDTLNRQGKVDFYFLSDHEADNLSAVMALKRIAGRGDSSPYEQNRLFSCYCHARRNNVNFALINSEGLRHQVHFIDSSSLSVWQLKKDVDCQPVNFVSIKTGQGTVATPFTAMVVGFGETGRDAFGFLYEYGSFVAEVRPGSDGKDHVIPQKKKILVVDHKLNALRAEFLSDRPGLQDDPAIEWYDDQINSESFAGKVRNVIDDLNCVVVTVGDDEEAISLATKICHLALRYRTAGTRLGLFVRIRHKEQKEKMMAVKAYFDRYNRANDIFIRIFGCNQDIFSYETLCHDVLEARAMTFFYQYARISAELSGSGDNLQAEKARLDQSGPLQEWTGRRNALNSSVKDHFTLYYQEEQDRSNAWHILTKRLMVGLKAGDETRRSECMADSRLITTMGYGEHLRWNARMYLMGFEYGPVKAIEKKQHPCLIDCDRLIRDESHKDTLLYDEAVVKLSLSKEFDNINND